MEEVNLLGSIFDGMDKINNGEEDETLKAIGAFLALPDEEFNRLKDGVLAEITKNFNNNDKLLLAQSMNLNGVRAEDLGQIFVDYERELEEQFKDVMSETKRDFLKQLVGIIFNEFVESEGISKRVINIPIQLIHEDAKIPTYANITDAGLDIYALEDITIGPGETKLIKTGLKVAIPKGYELQVRPKSGRSLKTKLRIANTPGTIDSGYRDEIGVIVENIEPPIKDIGYEFDDATKRPIITSILHGESYTISKGDKFAQLVLSEVPQAAFYEVGDIGEFEGDRGGGFGSTDNK